MNVIFNKAAACIWFGCADVRGATGCNKKRPVFLSRQCSHSLNARDVDAAVSRRTPPEAVTSPPPSRRRTALIFHWKLSANTGNTSITPQGIEPTPSTNSYTDITIFNMNRFYSHLCFNLYTKYQKFNHVENSTLLTKFYVTMVKRAIAPTCCPTMFVSMVGQIEF